MVDVPKADANVVEGLKRGAALIGGAPSYDTDRGGQIRRIFALAREYDVDVDIHLDVGPTTDDMDVYLVCELTDVIRDGAAVTGYAFNSTGRYACGAQMRERLIPRILRQDPDSLLDTERGGFDPQAIFGAMMFGEKPGGDMERSVGIGTIEVALWDAMAKIEDIPLHALIAERYGVAHQRSGKIIFTEVVNFFLTRLMCRSSSAGGAWDQFHLLFLEQLASRLVY